MWCLSIKIPKGSIPDAEPSFSYSIYREFTLFCLQDRPRPRPTMIQLSIVHGWCVCMHMHNCVAMVMLWLAPAERHDEGPMAWSN